MKINKTNLDNYITGNYGEDEQKLHKNMLFNLEEIREAVDWAFGDDGLRSKEVVEILKQTRVDLPTSELRKILKGGPDGK